jgi:hypothetical protein
LTLVTSTCLWLRCIFQHQSVGKCHGSDIQVTRDIW